MDKRDILLRLGNQLDELDFGYREIIEDWIKNPSRSGFRSVDDLLTTLRKMVWDDFEAMPLREVVDPQWLENNPEPKEDDFEEGGSFAGMNYEAAYESWKEKGWREGAQPYHDAETVIRAAEADVATVR